MAALAASLVNYSGFLAVTNLANDWILDSFDWLFLVASFGAVILLAIVFFSPLGGVRIGGPDAVPILSRWSWFSITLCTTIATGILFWGTAEPIFHITQPPAFSGVDPHSEGAAKFALASLFMHWTITPYAIYATPALAFALAHYNLGKRYSVSGPLSVVLGGAARGVGGAVVDALGLIALVAGVAASLGAGMMTLAGGVESMTGLPDGPVLRLVVTVLIVVFFLLSSISGIKRGIRFLSEINIRFFFCLAAFVFVCGPTLAILTLGAEGIAAYVADFVPRSLALGERSSDPWTRDWTVFNFANWLAWAPITALFLGHISVGYTVRELLAINFAAPAAFGGLWMMIFGGAVIRMDASSDNAISSALVENGPDAVTYALFDALPFAGVVSVLFVVLTFISFVTAMDSNTHSIANVCLKKTAESGAHQVRSRDVKIFWGVLVGAIAWVMTSTTGVDGVRMLSNLGGLPGLFILIGMMTVLIFMQVRLLPQIKSAAQAPASSLS